MDDDSDLKPIEIDFSNDNKFFELVDTSFAIGQSVAQNYILLFQEPLNNHAAVVMWPGILTTWSEFYEYEFEYIKFVDPSKLERPEQVKCFEF